MLPNASIDENSVNWRKIRYLKYSYQNFEAKNQTLGYGKNKIYLDDLEYSEKDYLLIGVRLNFNSEHGALYLQTYFMKFDFSFGKLIKNSETGWIYNKKTVERYIILL